jgi:2,5-diketo-D-gluconate reductase A
MVRAHAREGGGHETGEGGREGADAQPGAAVLGGRGDLGLGELEALGDGVGVREQDLALAREPQAARLAVQQAHTDLALQGSDLVGDRWLGERERASGAGERAVVRNRAKCQDSTWIHSERLSEFENDYLRLSLEPRKLSAMHIPTTSLNDGRTIPQLGFGVFQIAPNETAQAVRRALKIGYRHIDTAEMYLNERGVGQAVRASGLDRADVFVTSKLSNGAHRPDDARRAFERTLTELGFDYVDLFLIHWPLPSLYDGDFVSTWQALEEFHRDGRARSIGVSNFTIGHLDRLLAETDVVPAVNQIELHPYLLNDELREYGEEHGIATEAWSPIAQGAVLDDPVIAAIARRLHRSPAQVVLRWHIERGSIVFPKSTTPARIAENFALFDFGLDAHDVAAIDALDRGEAGRTGPNPDAFAFVPA